MNLCLIVTMSLFIKQIDIALHLSDDQQKDSTSGIFVALILTICVIFHDVNQLDEM